MKVKSMSQEPLHTDAIPLRVLVLEDQPMDAQLVILELRHAGYEPDWRCVDTKDAYVDALDADIDIILSDFSMPGFSGLEALEMLTERKLDIPFIFVSGSIGEDWAVRAMKSGASDYLIKDRMARLGEAVRNALEANRLRSEHEKAQAALARSYEELKASHAEKRRLLAGLIRAQEEERKLIAGDIHDDSIQVMSAVGLRLQMLRSRLTEPSEVEMLDRLDETVRLTITRLRRLLFDLRPVTLETEGLAQTLSHFLDKAFEGTEIRFEVDDRLSEDPPIQTRVVLYRLCQEALTNARKHALASLITVVLEEVSGGFRASISDDGIGFDYEEMKHETDPGHLGLGAIRERAELAGGWCRISSVTGEGTQVECWLPAEEFDERSPDD